MNVAIYGAAGMGTILGAYITKAGYDIDLINRNKDHVSMLNKEGAKIIGKIEFIQKVKALLPDEINKKYDIILLMTKQRYNRFHNTLIACRVPLMLKEKIEEFSQERDVSVSQVIRLGIKMALDLENTDKPSQWMIRQ